MPADAGAGSNPKPSDRVLREQGNRVPGELVGAELGNTMNHAYERVDTEVTQPTEQEQFFSDVEDVGQVGAIPVGLIVWAGLGVLAILALRKG